jgi:hypothetical protein
MAELEDIPPTTYPDGSVIGSFDAGTNPPEDPEILHRPHAFALMHGDGGAKVAYGQLLWRIDELNFWYKLKTATELDDEGVGSGNVTAAHGHGKSGQAAVDGLNAKVPTIDTEDGASMTSGINFNDNDTKYHQLDGYGDVYLYWKVDLDHADRVTKCWVTVDGTTAQGTYRVKLGSVNEDAQVTQDISSDVYWSIVLLKRINDTTSVTEGGGSPSP